ncbi:MAG: prepilin-type N-terminal cleavage/methylation domain-containing protein [Cytophagaceae bacterium]
MNKIKSFTVLEMLIVMLLSGITISAAYAIFSIFFIKYNSFNHTSEENYKIMLLQKLLKEDIDKAEKILKADNGFKCIFPQKTTLYTFEKEYILRQSIVSDTFYCKVNEFNCYFGKEEVLEGGLIDRVNAGIEYNKNKMNLYYQKQYAADQLINLNDQY